MEKNDIILVPDVHGRDFWKKAIPYIEEGYQTIFLGDYHDPYYFEGITASDSLVNFKELKDIAIQHKQNVTLLVGNHDLSYIPKMSVGADRKDYYNYEELEDIFSNLLEECDVRIYKEIKSGGKKFLLSHAGIHPVWIDEVKKMFQIEIKEFNDLLQKRDEKFAAALSHVSWYRGGDWTVGSMVWADCHEFEDDLGINNHYINEYTQIVGHTQNYFYSQTNGWQIGDPTIINCNDLHLWCIDCHRCFVVSNGELKDL